MAYPDQAELAAAVSKGRAALTASFWQPVMKRQQETTMDREAKGPCWVSRTTFAAPPEDDARQLLLDSIKELGTGNEEYICPSLTDVPAHWVGYRSGVSSRSPEPSISEAAKFEALNRETKNDMTIMYTYGGAHYINGPATRRAVATTLATKTSSRSVIIQHRLAPQNPFPSALLDVLHAYLTLLHPSPSSLHAPIPAHKLVLAGDSSGSQLSLALIQTILSFHRRHSSTATIQFHGRSVPLPLPAGVAAQSPGLDHQGGSLPSWDANLPWDIFPAVSPSVLPQFPADAAWPSQPPRGNLYAETSALAHPLVSPVVARSWAGAPPMYIACGSRECPADAARVVAQRAAGQGVGVRWDEYECMPHNWPMLLRGWPQVGLCFERWARACLDFGEGRGRGVEGWFTEYEGLGVREVDVRGLTDWSVEEVERRVREKAATLKPWTGPGEKCLL